MHLLVLGSRSFSALIQEVPSVARKILRVMAERLRTAEREAAVERRVQELAQNDQRLGELERARAEAERSLDERGAALRRELEEIYRQAAQRVAETRSKPGWRQRRHELKLARAEHARRVRRHELKLARVERDRKIRKAERRLAERSEDSLARIEREGRAAEERVRAARAEAERGLESAATDASMKLREECSASPTTRTG
jgi:hypothetical protein